MGGPATGIWPALGWTRATRQLVWWVLLLAAQVGDVLDRGDQELRILYFLERLAREAAAAGGAVHALLGNHETMNVGGNFRYATQGQHAVAPWRPS